MYVHCVHRARTRTFSQGWRECDQAESQLSANIDVLAARLALAESECEKARAETARLAHFESECEKARAESARLAHFEREYDNARAEVSRLAHFERECDKARVEVARLEHVESEFENARTEVFALRGECATLREKVADTELGHERCDAAVARLHRELQEVRNYIFRHYLHSKTKLPIGNHEFKN